jgi:hypothetical protein
MERLYPLFGSRTQRTERPTERIFAQYSGPARSSEMTEPVHPTSTSSPSISSSHQPLPAMTACSEPDLATPACPERMQLGGDNPKLWLP